MRNMHRLAAIVSIAFLFAAITDTGFAQGGRPGGPGMGGSGHHPGGGWGGSGNHGGRGLVGPSASFGFIGGGYGGGWGGGWGSWIPGYPNNPYQYENGNIPTPPYFAIHPPVYYGKRVGMPYGNSTVTRPPRAIVDDYPMVQRVVHVMQPAMITNPYVVSDVSEVAESAASSEPADVTQDEVQSVATDQPAVDKKKSKKDERNRKSKMDSRSKRNSRKPKR